MLDTQLFSTIIALYLPAMVANMAPVFAAKYNLLKLLNRPLDLGLTIRSTRLLGENKTIRGLIVGVITAGITGALVSFVFHAVPYDSFRSAITYGSVIGFGALAGDSVKSFFKRRIHIKPGALWIPFDQIDFVIGATLAAMLFVEITFPIFLFAIIFLGVLSYVVSKIGFALHIKKNL